MIFLLLRHTRRSPPGQTQTVSLEAFNFSQGRVSCVSIVSQAISDRMDEDRISSTDDLILKISKQLLSVWKLPQPTKKDNSGMILTYTQFGATQNEAPLFSLQSKTLKFSSFQITSFLSQEMTQELLSDFQD